MDNSTVADLALGNSLDVKLLNADEVAQILRVPRSWVYSHLKLRETLRDSPPRRPRGGRGSLPTPRQQGKSIKLVGL